MQIVTLAQNRFDFRADFLSFNNTSYWTHGLGPVLHCCSCKGTGKIHKPFDNVNNEKEGEEDGCTVITSNAEEEVITITTIVITMITIIFVFITILIMIIVIIIINLIYLAQFDTIVVHFCFRWYSYLKYKCNHS